MAVLKKNFSLVFFTATKLTSKPLSYFPNLVTSVCIDLFSLSHDLFRLFGLLSSYRSNANFIRYFDT